MFGSKKYRSSPFGNNSSSSRKRKLKRQAGSVRRGKGKGKSNGNKSPKRKKKVKSNNNYMDSQNDANDYESVSAPVKKTQRKRLDSKPSRKPSAKRNKEARKVLQTFGTA